MSEARIIDPLRERIRLYPSKYALAKKSNVSQSVLSRFCTKSRDSRSTVLSASQKCLTFN